MKKNSVGFSLIEVMIVLVVVSVLTALAYPSYQNSIRKNARSVAKSELLQVLSKQEQYFVNAKGYATGLGSLGYPADTFYITSSGDASTSSTSAIYQVQLASGASTTAFTINAVPQGSQAADSDCGTITLSYTGAESATGSLGSSCW